MEIIGNGLAAVIDVLYNSFGAFGAFVFAALLQPLVVTGTHQAIQGIEANLIATTGFNYIQEMVCINHCTGWWSHRNVFVSKETF